MASTSSSAPIDESSPIAQPLANIDTNSPRIQGASTTSKNQFLNTPQQPRADLTPSSPSLAVEFPGPANESFDSLHQQATAFLDEYWPYWREKSEAVRPQKLENYIIPQHFEYANPELSDGDVERIRDSDSDAVEESNRRGNHAEHLIFSALEQLVRENFETPFVCIHDADFNKLKNRRDILPMITSESFVELERCLHEYDFLIVGPRIGLWAIEVKALAFRGTTKGFRDGKADFPDAFSYGLDQLTTVDDLFSLISQCTETVLPAGLRFRKVLCVPNLDKARFDAWLGTLRPMDRQARETKLSRFDICFQSDGRNSIEHSEKPDYYSYFKTLFENEAFPISSLVYEKCTPIFSAMASIITMPSKKKQQQQRSTTKRRHENDDNGENQPPSPKRPKLELAAGRFSEKKSLGLEHCRIKEQNPRSGFRRLQVSSKTKLIRNRSAVFTEFCGSRIVFLSRDQQNALSTAPRQFIIGAAGTGKTLVLYAKAKELMLRGDQVCILAPQSFMMTYKRLLDASPGPKNYVIHPWASITPIANKLLTRLLYVSQNDLTPEVLARMIRECVNEEMASPDSSFHAVAYKWLWNDAHILIDDASDYDEVNFLRAERFMLAPLVIMAAASRNPKKVVWIAMDCFTKYCLGDPEHDHNGWFRTVVELILRKDPNTFGAEYHVSFLNQVMRCSELIFGHAYKEDLLNWRPELSPSLGHKIQGFEIRPLVYRCSTFEKAQNRCFHVIAELVEESLARGFSLNELAIVTGRYAQCQQSLRQFMVDQFKRFKPHITITSLMEHMVILFPHSQLSDQQADSLSISDWYKVSSMEFPTIIHAYVQPRRTLGPSFERNMSYQRYRAESRAMVRLIDVKVIFEASKSPWGMSIIGEDDEVMVDVRIRDVITNMFAELELHR